MQYAMDLNKYGKGKENSMIDNEYADNNHASYYGGEDNPYECIKVIEAWGESITVEQKSFTTISGNVNNDVNISYIAEQGTATAAPAINSGVMN